MGETTQRTNQLIKKIINSLINQMVIYGAHGGFDADAASESLCSWTLADPDQAVNMTLNALSVMQMQSGGRQFNCCVRGSHH